jgi:hypothetical protein
VAEYPGLYKEAETKLAEWARFTPLFVAQGSNILRPKYKPDGLCYGDKMPPGEFESHFVHGLASTSIDAANFTAEGGSLHEREYLAGNRLELSGYVMLRDDAPQEEWWQTIHSFSVGGCQSEGCGRLRLLDHPPVHENGVVLDEFAWQSGGCRLRATDGAHIAGFLSASVQDLAGHVEAVAGRGWGELREGKHGAGQKVEPIQAYWSPGSRTCGGVFEIDPYGTWLKVG